MRVAARSIACLFLLAALLSACGKSTNKSSDLALSGPRVALLLPQSRTARYDAQDKPFFQAKLKSLCQSCELLYANANQDAALQRTQADTAITNGAKVIVLDPVDNDIAASIVASANAANVPVISYDRLVNSADVRYFVSFDNEAIGKLQAQSLLDKLSQDRTTGSIVMINGAIDDPNAQQFRRGAHSVFDGKVTIGREYDTPGWSPDEAQKEMQQAITDLGMQHIAGVYAANDGTASGVIAALRRETPSGPIPPVTGQDAGLAAVQRIVAGDQFMTVYKSIKQEAEQAADLAAALAQGATPNLPTTKVNNGTKMVDSIILTPAVITKDNIKTTVVAEGLWTIAQICTDQYRSACVSAGLATD